LSMKLSSQMKKSVSNRLRNPIASRSGHGALGFLKVSVMPWTFACHTRPVKQADA